MYACQIRRTWNTGSKEFSVLISTVKVPSKKVVPICTTQLCPRVASCSLDHRKKAPGPRIKTPGPPPTTSSHPFNPCHSTSLNISAFHGKFYQGKKIMECIQNILSGMYKSLAMRRNMTLQGTDRCSVSSQIVKGSMFWDDIEDGYTGQTKQVFVSCFKHFGLYPKNIREQLKSFSFPWRVKDGLNTKNWQKFRVFFERFTLSKMGEGWEDWMWEDHMVAHSSSPDER